MLSAAQAVKHINDLKFRHTPVVRWLCGLIEKEIILFDDQPLDFPNEGVQRLLEHRQMIRQNDELRWCLDENVLKELRSRAISSNSPPPPPSSRNPASKKNRKKFGKTDFASD